MISLYDRRVPPLAVTALGELGLGLLAALIAAVAGFLAKRFLWPKIRKRWEDWQAQRYAPQELELALAYLTHLRDGVMPAVWRVADTAPEDVREHIRRNILEPIRGYVATEPGEHIRVVWFRPDEGGTNLVMYEQVGHTPEGQGAARLPIGSGIAGNAYTTGDTIYCADCASDQRFRDLPHGHRQGSIVCAPIQRAGETTGVLSVWSTLQDAFWLTERLYFEALAAAIGSLEAFEQPSEGPTMVDTP